MAIRDRFDSTSSDEWKVRHKAWRLNDEEILVAVYSEREVHLYMVSWADITTGDDPEVLLPKPQHCEVEPIDEQEDMMEAVKLVYDHYYVKEDSQK